jgi:hypothetical protein
MILAYAPFSNENDHALVHHGLYLTRIYPDLLCSLTTLDHAGHVTRRKGYAPHYIPANIARFQPEAHDYTLELVSVQLSHCCGISI